MLSKTAVNGELSAVTEFSYDTFDRTASITLGNGVTTSFAYNTDSDRISKTTGIKVTETVLDNGYLCADLVSGNNASTTKVFTNDNSVYCENGVFTYKVINSKGDLVATAGSSDIDYKYNAYGEKLSVNNSSNPIGYRNYYYDSETGLYYLKARYYDPTTGQFTQEDTVHDDNLQYNLYGYCSANPVLCIDPSGNCKTAKNLEQHYKKKDKNGKHTGKSSWPSNGINGLKISINGNSVEIVWKAKFSGKGINNKPSGWSYTYRDAIEHGIESKWSGTYTVFKHKNVKVTVNIVENKNAKGQVIFYNKKGISNASFANSNNRMNIYLGDSRTNYTYSFDKFKRMVAHEFGHVLGITDGYDKDSSKYHNSIMCDPYGDRNGFGKPENVDIRKALRAYKNRTWINWR